MMPLVALYLFLAVGGAMLSAFASSRKGMHSATLLHALLALALTVFAAATEAVPSFYFSNKYFFLDMLSLAELVLASAVFLFVATYAKGYLEKLAESGELADSNIKFFYGSLNLLFGTTALAFLANNLALFWIFAETTTFFCAVLVASLNSKKNLDAALKYVFVTSTAMIISFIGIIILFAASQKYLSEGNLNWDYLAGTAGAIPPQILLASFLFCFVGFAAKAGLAPFHTWLPHVYSKAPSDVSAFMSAVVSSIGMYGIIRLYSIARQVPSSGAIVGGFLIVAGLLSVFLGAFSMFQQRNLKKLLGFSSIENLGISLVGLGIGTPLAVSFSLFHLFWHSLAKVLLFFSAGILHRKYKSNQSELMRDVFSLQPLASFGLIAGSILLLGIPPSALFSSKLLIILEAAKASFPLLLFLLFLVLAASSAYAIFLIRLFSQVSEGRPLDTSDRFEAPASMNASILALVALALLLCLFFQGAIFSVLSKAAEGILVGVA